MLYLSLVLATYGRSDLIGRFIEYLSVQTCKNFELIVVDQNADDRVLPYIEQARCAGIAVSHYLMEKPNLSAARNLGIAHATGDVIAFPDDDCWYEPQVVDRVLTAFAANPNWQGVVADWVEVSKVRGKILSDSILCADKWRRYRDGDASSITLFFRTDLLKRVGGFDNRLGIGQWFGAGEETDLILTTLATGALLVRRPDIRVHHKFEPAASWPFALHWRSTLRRARGTGALYVKHRLPWRVVIRGFLAPPFVALRQRVGINGFALAMTISVGRIQGALTWLVSAR